MKIKCLEPAASLDAAPRPDRALGSVKAKGGRESARLRGTVYIVLDTSTRRGCGQGPLPSPLSGQGAPVAPPANLHGSCKDRPARLRRRFPLAGLAATPLDGVPCPLQLAQCLQTLPKGGPAFDLDGGPGITGLGIRPHDPRRSQPLWDASQKGGAGPARKRRSQLKIAFHRTYASTTGGMVRSTQIQIRGRLSP